MAFAAFALASCEDDKDPVISEPTEFVLNVPPFASQGIELAKGHTVEFTCSQPNYGLTLAPSYSVEVSMMQDFGVSLPEAAADEPPYFVEVPVEVPTSAVITVSDVDLSNAILKMRGIDAEEDYTPLPPHPLYVRVVAAVNNQAITRITSNVITLEKVQGYFSLNTMPKVLYTPGNSNGWNQEKSQWLREKADAPDVFVGFVYLNGDFKFCNQPNWDGINYGLVDDDDTVDDNPDDGVFMGKLNPDGGASNLTLPATGEGLYYAYVNINDLTYTLTHIESVALAGSATPDNWNPEVGPAMTSTDFLTWTYTGEFIDGEFKFVFNRGWGINLGIDKDAPDFGMEVDNGLIWDGGNIGISAGSHTVVLDLSKLPYGYTIDE